MSLLITFLAQSVERQPLKLVVKGSSPLGGGWSLYIKLNFQFNITRQRISTKIENYY